MNVPPRLVPDFLRSSQKFAPRSLCALPHLMTALLLAGLRVLFPRLVPLLLGSGRFRGLTGSIHFLLCLIHFALRLPPSGRLRRLPNSIRWSVHDPPPCQTLVQLSSSSDRLFPHVNLAEGLGPLGPRVVRCSHFGASRRFSLTRDCAGTSMRNGSRPVQCRRIVKRSRSPRSTLPFLPVQSRWKQSSNQKNLPG